MTGGFFVLLLPVENVMRNPWFVAMRFTFGAEREKENLLETKRVRVTGQHETVKITSNG